MEAMGPSSARPTRWQLRRAVAADYPAVCAVLEEANALHRAAAPALAREVGIAPPPLGTAEGGADLFAQATWPPLFDDPSHLLLVADAGGAIVGSVYTVLMAMPGVSPTEGRQSLFIHTLAVGAAWRRAGIARALMAAAHDWGVARGASAVELNVWEFNRGAIAFYEALGYRTARRRMGRTLPG